MKLYMIIRLSPGTVCEIIDKKTNEVVKTIRYEDVRDKQKIRVG
jgi:hypothetical protein